MQILGYGLFIVAGLWMWIAEVIAFTRWWDLTGILISVFIPPIAVVFPIIYWVKEGVFPVMYFIVWGVGLLGMFLAAFASKDS